MDERTGGISKSAHRREPSHAASQSLHIESNEVSDEDQSDIDLPEDGLHEWIGLLLIFLSAVLAIGVIAFVFT